VSDQVGIMIEMNAIPWGRPLATRYVFYAERHLGLHQRRKLQREVRNLCVRRRWQLIACNAGETRLQVVIGGRDAVRIIHRVLFALCEDSRPTRAWDTSSPTSLLTTDEVVEACTRVMYERTDGMLLFETEGIGM
jgi:hypothetical protein